eukprot:CAMPEP_0194417338 /NCGR_PEP_ID=MMETSP0176-20130528/16405_1 /TAXON_ID=216777 /ORGANISM="Proboscia alata, Strain PI-D3" /LENGTH=360 /DNA_ID=CAMNT_0039223165 /DNA_START=36 /DNA_END=1118 /DNA_ORIENTATION=-
MKQNRNKDRATAGGKNRQQKGHDESLSRKLSKLLRHRIDENGLRDCQRKDGYVPLSRVFALPQFRSAQTTLEDIQSVVRDNDKQRFALTSDEQGWWIRANQGHSIGGLSDEALLERIVFNNDGTPKTMVAIHGTYYKAWPAIKQSGGLSKMSRTHVHLAADLPGDGGTISGMRRSCELVIFVDVRSATLEGGIEFFRSSNGVILTRGNTEDDLLPMKYFTRVTDRNTGKNIWETGGAIAQVSCAKRAIPGIPSSLATTDPKTESKNARRNEPKRIAKQKRNIEEEEKTPTENAGEGAKIVTGNMAAATATEPKKRAKNLKKRLKEIEELKKKEASMLNDDQKKKLKTEEAVTKELENIEL